MICFLNANWETTMINQVSSIVKRSTFTNIPLESTTAVGGFGLWADGVKQLDQTEVAEHLITVETRGKHALQRRPWQAALIRRN